MCGIASALSLDKKPEPDFNVRVSTNPLASPWRSSVLLCSTHVRRADLRESRSLAGDGILFSSFSSKATHSALYFGVNERFLLVIGHLFKALSLYLRRAPIPGNMSAEVIMRWKALRLTLSNKPSGHGSMLMMSKLSSRMLKAPFPRLPENAQ